MGCVSCVTELRSGEYLSDCLLRSLCAPVSVVLGCSPFYFLAMSTTRGADKHRSSQARLKPSFVQDSHGWHIDVCCGSLSGLFYISKLDDSKNCLGKCVLAKGNWYSPPEFEALSGKKNKKWRQSITHLGKPLIEYDLTCPRPPAPSQTQLNSGASVSSPCPHVHSMSTTDNVLTSQTPQFVYTATSLSQLCLIIY